jgi:EF hand
MLESSARLSYEEYKMPNTIKSILLASAFACLSIAGTSGAALAQMECGGPDMMGKHGNPKHMGGMDGMRMHGMGYDQMGMERMPMHHMGMGMDMMSPGSGHAAEMNQKYDANKDGRVDQQELDNARTQNLQQFDADRNTRLSLDEYKALWLKENQLRIVREFQRFDMDGDAQVTLEEYKTQIPPVSPMAGNRDRRMDRGECGMRKHGYERNKDGMNGKRYHQRMEDQSNRDTNTQSSTMKENQEQLPSMQRLPDSEMVPQTDRVPQP